MFPTGHFSWAKTIPSAPSAARCSTATDLIQRVVCLAATVSVLAVNMVLIPGGSAGIFHRLAAAEFVSTVGFRSTAHFHKAPCSPSVR